MKWLFVFATLMILLQQNGYAKKSASKSVQRIEKALKVKGQSRTLSMMLVLKNKKEDIKFIKVRRDYKKEINNTKY